jgi:hypothetical protein
MRALADTSESAREVQLAAFREMGPAKRVAVAFEMSEEALGLTTAGVRARCPEWSEARIARAVRDILLGTHPRLTADKAPLTR